jgi:hypothetical protein
MLNEEKTKNFDTASTKLKKNNFFFKNMKKHKK